MTRSFPRLCLERLTFGLVAAFLGVTADAGPAGRTLMRYPTLSGNTIVFVAHDNLWSVPRTGGTASRLTGCGARHSGRRFAGRLARGP